MKTIDKCFSILLFHLILIMAISCSQHKTEWKGTIEEENGVTVVKNPKEPVYGNEVFSIEEDEEGYQFVKRYKVTWKY